MEYGITVTTSAPFARAVELVRGALAKQGFGVLTEIDIQATLRAKLGEEIEDYVILGACNPPLAHAALTADRQIGLLLPCNVVVRAGNGRTVVEALDPLAMVAISEAEAMRPVATEAAGRLRAALADVGAYQDTST